MKSQWRRGWCMYSDLGWWGDQMTAEGSVVETGGVSDHC